MIPDKVKELLQKYHGGWTEEEKKLVQETEQNIISERDKLKPYFPVALSNNLVASLHWSYGHLLELTILDQNKNVYSRATLTKITLEELVIAINRAKRIMELEKEQSKFSRLHTNY